MSTEFVPVPEGSSRDTDLMHQYLQEHISGCDECRYAIEKGGPKRFGQKSAMCREYFRLVNVWARGEMTPDDMG